MTYMQAQLYAETCGVIARINLAGTAVLFYLGDPDRKSAWQEIGRATIRYAVLDRRTVELICGRARI